MLTDDERAAPVEGAGLTMLCRAPLALLLLLASCAPPPAPPPYVIHCEASAGGVLDCLAMPMPAPGGAK